MPQIPSNINGVTVQFAATVVNDVDQGMIDGLKHCIRPQFANGHHLLNIYISSAFDSHKMPSRHMRWYSGDGHSEKHGI